MKKIFRCLAVCLAFTALFMLSGCASGNEALEALPALIERAEVLNRYIWGVGPEVTEYDDSSVTASGTSKYVRVADTSEFTTLAALTEAILQTYSTDYCDIIFEIVLEGGEDTFARYNEDAEGVLTFNVRSSGYELRTVLDASAARVKSTGFNRVVVAVPCTFDGQPDGDYEVNLVWENGEWKLDSPTY